MSYSNPRPIAHIGYHKTGTSWFQNFFYPFTKSHYYVPRSQVRKSLLFDHAFAFDGEKTRKDLRVNEKYPYILCEEELSGSFETGGHLGGFSKEIAERIYKIDPQTNIAIFIRNQKDILSSVYAQYIKMGGTKKPEKLFFPRKNQKSIKNKPFKVPLFSFDHFNYIGLIEYYKEFFSPEQIHVFLYEDFKNDTYKFLEKYSDIFGIDYTPDHIKTEPFNVSFRLRTLKFARFLNHFTHRGVVDKKYLASLPPKPIEKLPKKFNRTTFSGPRATPENLLGQEIIAYINNYYKETNDALSYEINVNLKSYGYP